MALKTPRSYQIKLSDLYIDDVYCWISDSEIGGALESREKCDLTRNWYDIWLDLYGYEGDEDGLAWTQFHAIRVANLVVEIATKRLTEVTIIIDRVSRKRAITDGNHRIRALRYMCHFGMIDDFTINVNDMTLE